MIADEPAQTRGHVVSGDVAAFALWVWGLATLAVCADLAVCWAELGILALLLAALGEWP